MAFASSTMSQASVEGPIRARQLLAHLGEVVVYETGQTVLTGGESNEHLHLIEDGEVDVVPRRNPARMGPGAYLGEAGFLEGREPVTIVAKTPTRIRKVSRGDVVGALGKTPTTLHSLLDELKRLMEQRAKDQAPSAAETFAASLAAESLSHRAVRHPYLARLGAGEFPDLRWALRDFATHYYSYSRHFPRYLTTVMSRLEHPDHRAALLDNLTEESGAYEAEEVDVLSALGIEPDWYVGTPHPQLFRRFAEAMGASTEVDQEADQVVCWREMFLEVLRNGSAAEAVGALGLGTENIVSTIYKPFVRAIEMTDINPRDSVFFVLHTAIDDDHQEVLQQIATSFAHTGQGRSDLRRGMLKALQCRASFWDWLLERAENPWQAKSVL